MISKRNYTTKQKVLLAVFDAAEYVAKQTPFILCSGVTLLCVVGVQKLINQRIIYNCKLEVSELISYPTAVGDSYACVSKMMIYGPPVPLKP
jgi:hypothetical protein